MSKIAVVTGAGKGAGRGIAKVLAKNGVEVVVVSRTKSDLESLVKEIEADNGKAHLIVADTTDKTAVEALAREVKEKYERAPDILVNNAGCYVVQDLSDADYQSWDRMVDLNIKGYLYMIGAFLADMKARNAGHIVNITSDNEKYAAPGLAVYCGTKFFWTGCAQALRLELNGSQVRVTNIQPGWIWTEGLADLFADKAQTEVMARHQLGDSDKMLAGKERMLTPEDVGVAVWEVVNKPQRVQVQEVLLRDEFSCY